MVCYCQIFDFHLIDLFIQIKLKIESGDYNDLGSGVSSQTDSLINRAIKTRTERSSLELTGNHSNSALMNVTFDTREKCMMLIKEEPVSPGVRGAGKGAGGGVGGGDAVALTSASSTCEVCSSEPPVLPVAMVQSVLEGRGSMASVLERRSKRPLLDRYTPHRRIQ